MLNPIRIGFNIDDFNYHTPRMTHYTGQTAGTKVTFTAFYLKTMSAGEHTFKMRWVAGDSLGQTLYARDRNLIVIEMKK